MHLFVYLICLFSTVFSQNDSFHLLPRFWTNTGFCPSGDIENPTAITNSLLSYEMRIHLQLIGALPNAALSNIRIHWLLELIDFIEYETYQIPKYDFSKLDKLIWFLDRAELGLGFEMMGNPSRIFSNTRNESMVEFLWEDLAFQIGKRYLSRFLSFCYLTRILVEILSLQDRLGPSKVKQWKFESWNEPDLVHYNILKFKTESKICHALRRIRFKAHFY